MGERLIPKLDRLGAEAGIKQMTPEIYNFALLVRADVVAQWPERPWVGLTDDVEIFAISNTMPYADRFEFARAVEAKLKEKNT
jgi:hypothetical protein